MENINRLNEVKIKIAPSLLSADFSQLGNEAGQVIDYGADWLHLDIMDGHFVDNLTFGPPIIKCLRQQQAGAFLDCHLMVSEPAKWFGPLFDSRVDQIIFHVETQSLEETTSLIQRIKADNDQHTRAGICYKPGTVIDLEQIEQIKTWVEQDGLDYVLIMTVEPGFGGQALLPECLEKVKRLRDALPDLDIGVDGGVNAETIKICAEAGANVMVAGSAIFRHQNDQRREAIFELRRIAEEYLYLPPLEEVRYGTLRMIATYFGEHPESIRYVFVGLMTGYACYEFFSCPKNYQSLQRIYKQLSDSLKI